MKQTYIYDKIKIVLWEFPGGLCASRLGEAQVRSLVGELIPQTVPPAKRRFPLLINYFFPPAGSRQEVEKKMGHYEGLCWSSFPRVRGA